MIIFIIYGIIIITLSYLIGRDVNKENVSSNFVLYKNLISAIGSFSLAIGIIMLSLIKTDTLFITRSNIRKFYNIFSVILFILSLLFLIFSILMYQETRELKITRERLGKVCLISFIISSFSCFFSLLLVFPSFPFFNNHIKDTIINLLDKNINK